jgi:Phage integrase, N-terminal SAM-like domain
MRPHFEADHVRAVACVLQTQPRFLLNVDQAPWHGSSDPPYRSIRRVASDLPSGTELNKLLREIETGTDLEPGRLTTAEFLEQWLDVSRSRVGPRTWERYAQLMSLHVVPVLGSIPLGKLRPLHLERLYSKLLGKGLAARTVLHVHRVLHSALRRRSGGSLSHATSRARSHHHDP